MKKLLLVLSILAAGVMTTWAQNPADQTRYRRSSLCSILVKHSEQKFAKEIEEQFLQIPIPDKYNDHDLSVKVVSVDKKGKYGSEINNFVEKNQIASRLVGKWFDRNILTGECTLDLIKERGLYDASAFDFEMAQRSARGRAMLEDAGEDLIGNTYLLMNEVSYIDKGQRSQIWGKIGGGLLAIASIAAGASASDAMDLFNATDKLISSYKGFSVKIQTRLYRLTWDDEASGTFYTQYYTDVPDDAKRDAFEKNRDKFKLKYIGEVTSKGGTTSFLGINEDEPQIMVRKACTRAIDDNVSDLQKKYEEFRIKSPVLSVSPTITAQIGLKEGITKDSKFEVLEAKEENGKIKYTRVGVVKPVATKIWDNRFMASEERAYGADFGATTFTKVSGGDFYPGMLLKEIID